MDLTTLLSKTCTPKVTALSADAVTGLLKLVPGWELAGGKIARTFGFKDYYQTIAFVNAVAWISHQQDHHPDLEVSYNKCRISYNTHSVGGLSESDFICAAKVNAL
ncbi:4a-hydroxytetrahydrobiopterin dehydratase [Humisphaera borealis]|uniref:Putative pterin-4-alpha-carbinolamine dehydratase n=1 Tax=Humisphaera borealis TaxID=2807512 RepID=A0A7M2WWR1_9BACT|nr:4a-hydroxytetrahydrobiopterin dehydratase [Humisphaera borealis]QOV89935.1 4a-hydroxytetrahydrobiopterin dehydratase [Humisphaera borealis]